MKCNKARKWIALHREGELEAGIRERLREHLEECESCNQVYQSYLKNDRMAAQIRAHRVASKNEDGITNRIMNAVADMQKRPGETMFLSPMERIVKLTMLPAVRWVAAACILIIVSVFIYQQAYIYSNTSRLEKQLSDAGKAGTATSASVDMQDCMKKSAQYLSGFKTGQIKINEQIDAEFTENPEAIMQYASYICTHNYKYLKTNISQDEMTIPDFLFYRALENFRK